MHSSYDHETSVPCTRPSKRCADRRIRAAIGVIVFLFSCRALTPDANADRGLAEIGVKAFLSGETFARNTVNTFPAYKMGFSMGGTLRYDLVEWFAIQPELIFASRGSEVTLDGNFLSKYQLRYLELPVLLRATLPRDGRGMVISWPVPR